MDIDHIIPDTYSAEEVERALGREYHCPFCSASSTQNKGALDIAWIRTPLRLSEPRYICVGCCIDIYSTCASSKFNEHPYRDIVENAARHESLPVAEFRKRCIHHQLEVIAQRTKAAYHPEYAPLEQHLKQLLVNA